MTIELIINNSPTNDLRFSKSNMKKQKIKNKKKRLYKNTKIKYKFNILLFFAILQRENKKRN